MKLKLTLFSIFVVLGLYAQKQIQPYNFSVSDKDKTETIMIYAAASSANNLTFTLKNAKDEVLFDNEDNEISFQVFPFTEVSFGKHLTDAITSIKDNEVENTYDIIKERITDIKDNPISQKQKIAVQDVRNIYQFFNALAITAFAYDTEPVAGVLKYTLNTTITKKNIEGFDADVYFTKRAKHLRDIIFKGENTKNEGAKDSVTTEDDPMDDKFIGYVLENHEASFDDFYQNSKGRHWHKARVKFKHYAEKKLKELYNVYQIKNLIECGVFKKYQSMKTELTLLNDSVNLLNISKSNTEKLITALKETVKNDELKLKEASLIRTDLEFYKNKKISIDARIDEVESQIKEQKITLENLKIFLKDAPSEQSKDKVIKQEELVKNLNSSLANYNTQKKEVEDQINILNNNQKLSNIIENIKTFGEVIVGKKNTLDSLTNSKKNLEQLIRNKKTYITAKQNLIDIYISSKRSEIKKLPLWNFKVETIEIDINDGFIEHITTVGKAKLPVIDESLVAYVIDSLKVADSIKKKDNRNSDLGQSSIKEMLENFYNERIVKEIFNNIIDKELKFENEFPIGFSSKSDFADLHKYTLYAFEGAEKIFSLPVTNVITLYVQRHQNDRLDFSPKDQVVSLPSDDFARSNAVELKKETSSKILNVNIYSDFLGLKEGNPNGLLQFEVEKNIPLWTKRMVLGVGRSSNLGIVNYVNFNLTWAKIGDENKQLQVKYADRYVNNEYHPDRYVTFLDMIKYENTSVGADLNIASFDFPLLKARIELNAGIHYGRVNVVDTLTNDVTKPFDKNVNIIRAYPDFILRIRPEERFGAYFRFRPFKTIVPNNEEFYTVSSEKEFVDNQKLTSKWLHRFELGTYYTPSPKGDNKFFFRYRYTNTSDWETNGYGEFQVGYLVYLKF